MSDVAGLKKVLSRRMEGAVEVLHKEFTGLRTGRASVSLLEPVMVEAYGVPTPPIPALNEERRAELSKVAGKYAEQAKISVRNVRRDGMDQLKKWEKDSDISKDEMHDEEKEIQKLTDKVISDIDETLSHKEQEIMQV